MTVDSFQISRKAEMVTVNSGIGITLLNPEYYSTNASAWLDEQLREYESGFLYSEFKLLERSQVSVAGVQGEQIIFSHTVEPSLGDKWQAYPMRGRKVYFYSSHVLWEFNLDSRLSESEEASKDFEHVLQSFKIFD